MYLFLLRTVSKLYHFIITNFIFGIIRTAVRQYFYFLCLLPLSIFAYLLINPLIWFHYAHTVTKVDGSSFGQCCEYVVIFRFGKGQKAIAYGAWVEKGARKKKKWDLKNASAQLFMSLLQGRDISSTGSICRCDGISEPLAPFDGVIYDVNGIQFTISCSNCQPDSSFFSPQLFMYIERIQK